MSRTLENIAAPAVDYAEVARQALEADRCALVVVDIQEKLLPPIFQKEQLVRNAQLLIRAAGVLKIPALASTQYAKGLGATVPEVASLLPETEAIDKNLFSCFGSEVFCTLLKRLPGNRNTLLLCGMESHILRNPDGVSGFARRLHCSRCFGCSQLAHGMELENRTGADARRGSGNFFDRDDDL